MNGFMSEDMLDLDSNLMHREVASERSVPELPGDDFTRRFSMRTRNLMWFLGAGVSAAGGIPTAGDMIWEFKQKLYVSQRRASPEAVADLSAHGVRQLLQSHIDSAANLSTAGAADEYSCLFEAVFPAEADRRTYLDAKMAGARPTYGHLALATLMRANHAGLVWTTNFDPLIADACAKLFGSTGALTTATLEGTSIARQAISESRWPVEVKLHGDFRSRRLKNTTDELRHQDQQFRDLMVDCCSRFGLVVAGYSGRDDSVMDAFEAALDRDGAFPGGLFWIHRGDDEPYERVGRLLTKATALGIESGLVRAPSFDEVMRDIVRMVAGLDLSVLDEFGKQRSRWTGAPMLKGKEDWPLVRLNAIPIQSYPTVYRRVVCNIGGYREIRDAVEAAGVDVITGRNRAGVLAFGSDSSLKAAFRGFNISEFDLAPIEPKRLRYESAERGLIREAIGRAICRQRNMTIIRKRETDLLFPNNPNAADFLALKEIVGDIQGRVSGMSDLRWHEGLGIRLDWAADSLCLLIDPIPVFTNVSPQNKAAAASFGRERTFKRYNATLNDLITFWAKFLIGDGLPLQALGIADGVEAAFEFTRRTGFSKRASA